MGLYSDLENFFDYLISVRKLKTYLSFDIELPKTWKIPKRYANEEKVVEIQSKTDNKRSFSFVSEFNQSDVDLTVNNIKNIISYNKEIEQKERLLQSKIQELKQIFEKVRRILASPGGMQHLDRDLVIDRDVVPLPHDSQRDLFARQFIDRLPDRQFIEIEERRMDEHLPHPNPPGQPRDPVEVVDIGM